MMATLDHRVQQVTLEQQEQQAHRVLLVMTGLQVLKVPLVTQVLLVQLELLVQKVLRVTQVRKVLKV